MKLKDLNTLKTGDIIYSFRDNNFFVYELEKIQNCPGIKEAFDELMKLCRPIDIGDDYKAILEEELIRKHGGVDRKYEGAD